ncbi:MAG: CoA-acylating methylmalonate-semialdehyde dehydrogenase [Devosia sp.]|uniref:CoA-acylating methylmalonate-semialdehyde dehydrogenase n=1 Tax=Devosia sp. TaxID=1871048 RepID=UPI0024C782E2|nr:CoA-acylating methylmalonate-semialdehyde dehydrogenase [Devosia sp.]UYN99633.1 MAG: CoA-acylating methylmalonate-semialdehyde dehydrogenase [Devosia sp.]
MRTIGHFIDGVETNGQSTQFQDVFNPATGDVQARVALATDADLQAAVASAAAAQPKWAATNPQRRARVFFNFVALINQNIDELAELLSAEHGKTIEDSKGDIQRGLEVSEFVAGAPHLLKGEYTDGAGPGIDMYSMRQPVGIGAGITPFNFPAMISLWMLSPAIAAGNAFILKPSERDPSVPVRLAQLALEAGLPKGILNVVHGGKSVVDAILAHEKIEAISFVGSTPIARYVYGTAAANGKRVQAFGGAKNHMVIMPDADMDKAADALMGAGFGSAGERCMAVSVAVPVGAETADRIVAALKPRIEKLKVGPATDKASEMGPVITQASKDRIAALVESGVAQGATLAVDGRGFKLQGYENGYFVGPTLFDNVTAEMDIYKEEIFGPVLCVARATTYEDALDLVIENPYGNGTAIFTRDGDAARDFAARVNIGMVGVNVPVPVPLAYHSFGGWKASAFGDLNQHGTDSIKFWTRTKTVTARWPSGIKDGAEFQMPVMK